MKTAYKYFEDRAEWIGVAATDDGVVVTVSCHSTESEVEHWLDHYAETGEELPDLYSKKPTIN